MNRKGLYRALANLNVDIRETEAGATLTTPTDDDRVAVVSALARAGIEHAREPDGSLTVFRGIRHTHFSTALRDAGISQAGFRRAVERLTGHRLDSKTTSQWVRGKHMSPLAVAVASLLCELSETRRLDLTQ